MESLCTLSATDPLLSLRSNAMLADMSPAACELISDASPGLKWAEGVGQSPQTSPREMAQDLFNGADKVRRLNGTSRPLLF